MTWQFHRTCDDEGHPRDVLWSHKAVFLREVEDLPQPYSFAQQMPARFPAYVKIFHPMWLDPTEDDRTHDEVARDEGAPQGSAVHVALTAGTVAQRTMDTEDVTGQPGMQRVWWRDLLGASALTLRTDWRTLTKVLGSSWPAGLYGPGEGHVEDPMLERLVAHVRPWTHGPIALHASTAAEVPGHGEVSYQCTEAAGVDDVLAFKATNKYSLQPTLWYDRDETWMVFSDQDLCSTHVAGPEGLVADILADPDLETIPFEADDPAFPAV